MSAMKKLSDMTPHKKDVEVVNTKNKEVHPHKKDGHTPSIVKDKENSKKHIRKMILIVAASMLLLVAIGAIIMNLISAGTKLETNSIESPLKTTKKAIVNLYSPLTGKQVADEATTKKPVLAVMIENSLEARPQSGLKEAGVVFEAVAEGGITRFIALYQESTPSLIGPVRSIRPYYVEWAAAFSAGIAHVGGSSDALAMIRSGNYGTDMDQSSNGAAYWRATDRRSPHNVYTDYSHLKNLADKKNKSSSTFSGFTRQDIDGEAVKGEEPATKINLAVSTGKFAVSYQYDSSNNTYNRFQGGVKHQDRENGQISPSVVIAIRVNQTLKSDRIHNDIVTTGSGECFVFQNGTLIKGTWQKNSAAEQIKFLDQSGKEIGLNRGQTWVTAVAKGKSISWQ